MLPPPLSISSMCELTVYLHTAVFWMGEIDR